MPYQRQGFTNNPKPETLDWYRAAELKHGRVAMLAALGQIVQHFWQLPDASGVFSEGDKPFEALNKVGREARRCHGVAVVGLWCV